MVDLVGTCPKDFWDEWIAEGDAAGEPESGEEWGWFTEHSYRSLIKPGDRFYVVAHGKLRGWAPVIGVQGGAIIRKGGAVACTIDEPIPGFRGLRKRWWDRAIEQPFPDWKTVKPILRIPETPHCPKCGYTYQDCRFHGDHHLCGEPEPLKETP